MTLWRRKAAMSSGPAIGRLGIRRDASVSALSALRHSRQTQPLREMPALREVHRVVAHCFGAEPGDGEIGARHRATAQTSAASARSRASANSPASMKWESPQFGLISTVSRRLSIPQPLARDRHLQDH